MHYVYVSNLSIDKDGSYLPNFVLQKTKMKTDIHKEQNANKYADQKPTYFSSNVVASPPRDPILIILESISRVLVCGTLNIRQTYQYHML